MKKGEGYYTSWVASPVLSAVLLFHPVCFFSFCCTGVFLDNNLDRPCARLNECLGPLFLAGMDIRSNGEAFAQ